MSGGATASHLTRTTSRHMQAALSQWSAGIYRRACGGQRIRRCAIRRPKKRRKNQSGTDKIYT